MAYYRLQLVFSYEEHSLPFLLSSVKLFELHLYVREKTIGKRVYFVHTYGPK
jgi:hypothetical protein